MVEVIAVGFLLSVLTIVLKKSGNGLGLLDPWGARMVSIYMLAVMLSLLMIANIARSASLLTQTCMEDTVIIIGRVVEDGDFKGLEYMEECTHYHSDPATICELEVGTYVVSYRDNVTSDEIFWEFFEVIDEDGKYFCILDCGDDI